MEGKILQKKCNQCHNVKSVGSFYKKDSERLWHICKSCCLDNAKLRRKTDLKWVTYQREKSKEYRQKNPIKFKEIVRNSTLKKKYGITSDQYRVLLESQGYKCKICGSETAKGYGSFHVDHDHKTGRIRGLLCQGCNTSIGKFQDNPKLLRRAADYLEEVL